MAKNPGGKTAGEKGGRRSILLREIAASMCYHPEEPKEQVAP